MILNISQRKFEKIIKYIMIKSIIRKLFGTDQILENILLYKMFNIMVRSFRKVISRDQNKLKSWYTFD